MQCNASYALVGSAEYVSRRRVIGGKAVIGFDSGQCDHGTGRSRWGRWICANIRFLASAGLPAGMTSTESDGRSRMRRIYTVITLFLTPRMQADHC